MKKILLITMILCMVFVTACSNSNTNNANINSEIMTVNNTVHEITDEEFDVSLESYKNYYRSRLGEDRWAELQDDTYFNEKIEEMVLENLILEKVFIDEAKLNNLSVTDEEKQKELQSFKDSYSSEEEYESNLKLNDLTEDTLLERIEKQLLIEKFVSLKSDLILKVEPTDDELKEFYEENKVSYNKVRASHILVDSLEKAQELKKQLDDGADFAELAKENSSDTTAADGGDLGFFTEGQMVQEFNDVAFALGINEVSEPVKTQYGYHIIKVTDKQADYESVDKEQLKADYQNDIYNKMCINYIDSAKLTISDRLKTIRERSVARDTTTTSEK